MNHPFSPLFSPQDFAGVDFSTRGSCALPLRCWSGWTTAPARHPADPQRDRRLFPSKLHDQFTSPLNRIEVGISPHFAAEVPRRKSLAGGGRGGQGTEPLPPALLRAARRMEGRRRSGLRRCRIVDDGLLTPGDAGNFAGNWGCGEPVHAARYRHRERIGLAQCLPPPDGPMYSGLPCLQGRGDVEHRAAIPRRPIRSPSSRPSRRSQRGRLYLPAAAHPACRANLPTGAATKRTKPSPLSSRAKMPPEICGLTGGKKFDLCVATGKFDECLAGAVQQGNRARCDAEHFCRDDYMYEAFRFDTPNVKEGEGRRLLLADLFPVPDAHRQSHDAVEEPPARRLPTPSAVDDEGTSV